VVLKYRILLILIFAGLFILLFPSSTSACTYKATITGNHLDFAITSDFDKLAVIQYIRLSGSALVSKMYGVNVGIPWTYSDDPNCNIYINDPVGCRQIRNEVESGVLGTGAFWQWYDWPSSQYHVVPGGIWGLDFNSPPDYATIGIEYGILPGTSGQYWTFCDRTGDVQTTPPSFNVITHVVNDNSGTKQASGFTINVVNNYQTLSSFSGNEIGTPVALSAGLYNITEATQSGYLTTYSTDCKGVISNGDSKTCIITNDDIASPTPPVTKVFVIPGLGASWNVDALISCKNYGYGGVWTLAPYAKDIYSPLISALPSKGFTAVPFYYDWRQNVTKNAQLLNNSINSSGVALDEKVDIVGHSMGGLIGEDYLANQNGGIAAKFLAVGTPNQGSALAYPTVVNGEVWTNDLVEKIAATLFIDHCAIPPSLKNLLPTYDYLRDNKTGKLKTVALMRTKNDFLPINFVDGFWGVKVGTLYGTGISTLKTIDVIKDPKWPDGKPVSKENVKEGDGTVLIQSAQITGANNQEMNESHSGIIASSEGVSHILTFLGTPSTDNPGYLEHKSALILVGYPGTFSVTDEKGNKTDSENGMVAIMDPKDEDYQLQITPSSQNTTFIVGEFLSNGQTLYKEYKFKGLTQETKIIEFSSKHPNENILHEAKDYKNPNFPKFWFDFWKFWKKYWRK